MEFQRVLIVGLCSLLITIPVGIVLTRVIDSFLNFVVFLYRVICKLPCWLSPPRFEPFFMDRHQFEYHQRAWMRQPSLFWLSRGVR